MAVEVTKDGEALLPTEALRHPAFDALRPWLARLGERPCLDDLNALAQAEPDRTLTASGKPVRFCAAGRDDRGHYEQRIFDTGLVATRTDNRHDLFNALVWLAFPRIKAALNARHVARLKVEGTARGSLRDLLTLFDEGGVIVAASSGTLGGYEALVREFRWQELFWHRRAELLRDTRFVLVGHDAYEKALNPYPGITCKTLFVATPDELPAGLPGYLLDWIDRHAAAWIGSLPDDAKPRQMAPLPVFGRPGWLPQAQSGQFYEDRRWFRAPPASKEPPEGLSGGSNYV